MDYNKLIENAYKAIAQASFPIKSNSSHSVYSNKSSK